MCCGHKSDLVALTQKPNTQITGEGFSFMTEKQVKAELKKHKIKWSDFKSWIVGQTCPVLESGEVGYYSYDVERFIRNKVNGEKLSFD